MARTVVVSDLHIDTWTDRKIARTGKSRKEHFFELLDWCERVKVRELVINGDLMDFPPYSGQYSFPEGPSISRDVVERLISFGSVVPVTYIYGNHDIGISGFRCMGEDNVSFIKNINLCYPDYVIDDYPSTTILIEHGHFCDPVILLYLRDLTNRTYRESRFEEFQWAMQRRNAAFKKEGPGLFPPPQVTPGEVAYFAAKEDQKPLAKMSLWSRVRSFFWRWGSGAISKPTMEHWWREALDEMESYISRRLSEEKDVKPVLYQIYGHTHRADPRDPVMKHGIQCIYINAGTWTESADQGWYLDIDENGKIWLQDWINEPVDVRRV